MGILTIFEITGDINIFVDACGYFLKVVQYLSSSKVSKQYL